MIIPIRCFTCGNVLADKWVYYQAEIKRQYGNINKNRTDPIYMSSEVPNTIEKQLLDKLQLKRYCCRLRMLTHVDLSDIV